MKNYAAKFFKIALLAILIVTLVAIFAACNLFGGDDEDSKIDFESSLLEEGLPSYEEVQSYIAYVYNKTREKNSTAKIQFASGQSLPWDDSDEMSPFTGLYSEFVIQYKNEKEAVQIAIFNYKSEKAAEDVVNYYKEMFKENGATQEDMDKFFPFYKIGNSILEAIKGNGSDEGDYITPGSKILDMYKEVLNSKLPAGAMSDAHVKFIKETYDAFINKDSMDHAYRFDFGYEIYNKYEKQNYGNSEPNILNYETFACDREYRDSSNISSEIVFTNNNDPNSNTARRLSHYQELVPQLEKEYYTSDSYIDFEKEDGYVFAKLTDKLGFRYANYGSDGIRIKDYKYDENSPEKLVIPSTIDGKKVLAVDNIPFYLGNFKTIELSEGILNYYGIKCAELETLILPKSIEVLSDSYSNPIYGCVAIKTIKYAGTKSEWEELVKNNDPNTWFVDTSYDDEKHDTTYQYKTFKVECKDETITYSHND